MELTIMKGGKTMLRLTKNNNIQLSNNFNSNEFDCHCNNPECLITVIDQNIVDHIQKIRDFINKPLKITSGYRCEAHNKDVGGVKDSTHTKGQAVDVQATNLANIRFYSELINPKYSIGKYSDFVHLDTRTTNRRW